MGTRYFALILGIIYVIVAILGFIPGLATPPPADAPSLALSTSYGYIFSLFAVNIVHSLVHLIVGIWGILAFRGFGAARVFSRTMFVVFAILTILGLIPGLNTLFGFVPLFGADVALHAVTALLAAYFGFVAPGQETYSDTDTPATTL
jgi:hypothetical protein